MKYQKRRLEILEDYKRDVIRFSFVSLISVLSLVFYSLILKDNPYSMSFFPLLSCVLVWYGLVFSLLFKSLNKNMLLWVASLLTVAYAVSFNESILGLIFFLVTVSFLYEVVMRFYFGAHIKFKIHEYPWCLENKK